LEMGTEMETEGSSRGYSAPSLRRLSMM